MGSEDLLAIKVGLVSNIVIIVGFCCRLNHGCGR